MPGPVPWLGVALDYGKDAGAMLQRLRSEHGDTFSVFLAGDRVTFVTHPHDYQAVLANRDLDFHQLANEISAAAFGHGLEGFAAMEAHGINEIGIQQMRGEALVAMTESAQHSLHEQLVEGEVPGQVDDFYDWLGAVVFQATGRSVFGEGFADQVSRADFHTLDDKFPLLLAGIPARLLGVKGAQQSLQRAMAIGRSGAAQVTLDRLRLFAEHAPAHEVGAYQLAFLWATQANTLPTAFWTLFLAAQVPEAMAALTGEVRSVLDAADSHPETGLPILGREVMQALVHVDSALDEALRLTSGSLTIRVALRDTELTLHDGTPLRIRQGERVGLYPWLTHHDPRLYPEPKAYRFDRFVQDGKRRKTWTLEGKRVTHPLMPFGGGVSMCPGRHFARNEIKVLVATLLHHFDLKASPGPRPAFVEGRAGLGVFAPAQPVPMTLTRRA